MNRISNRHIDLQNPGIPVERNPGKLTVVGAGPGDIELITVKAIKALQSADVVLYDALVNIELLDYAEDAEKIFVGKRKGCYAFHQEQINDLIVERASHGLHVVRLKGGDPFVFGRGAEEMVHAAKHGMQTSAVPGISSSVSVPAMANIPVTKKRGVREFLGHHRHHQGSQTIRGYSPGCSINSNGSYINGNVQII